MPDLFYPCCQVGDRREYEQFGTLKADCWMCGLPTYELVSEMNDFIHPFNFLYKFTYCTGRKTRPTGEPPPWRI